MRSSVPLGTGRLPALPAAAPACSALQIAVLKETEGKGPYCSLVMAVVVVKDVLLFVTFAVNIELARAVTSAVSWVLTRAGTSAVSWVLARAQPAPGGE